MSNMSRRKILAAGTAGGVMTATVAAHAAGVFGNPDSPPQGAINTNGKFTDPGPQNTALANNLPSFENPPATDVGGMPVFWSSFNISPKRVQNGGWARQVNDTAFPISTTIAGVNMRLTAGGIRELHWHQAAEWAVMVYGNVRVTTIDAQGRPYVADVKTGDIWYFPPGPPPYPFIFRLSDMKPNKANKSGTVQIADSTNFQVSKTVAAALVTVKPGGMREMHWHPNADEWQYYVSGQGRMTVFNAGPAAVTADFQPGDIGYVLKNLGHYVENTGNTDLVFLEIFKADKYEEVSLANWLAHSPAAQVAVTLNMDPAVIARFQKDRAELMPA